MAPGVGSWEVGDRTLGWSWDTAGGNKGNRAVGGTCLVGG